MKKLLKELGIADLECSLILDKWMEWNHIETGEFDQVWFGYAELSDQTLIDIKTLKRFMKLMRDNNIAYYCSCVNCEGIPQGSGNFIYDKHLGKSWEEIKELLE